MKKIALIIGNPIKLRRYRDVLHLQPGIVCALAVGNMVNFRKDLPKRSGLDIIFLDGSLPDNSNMQAVAELRKQFPLAEIILLVEKEDSCQFFSALQSGATGYLKKGFSEFELPEMIRAIENGGALIEPTLIRKLVEHFHTLPNKITGIGPIEQQLLQLFYDGLTYKEAAGRLGISVDGIKYYVKNIYRKLGVNKKIDALRMFREQLDSN